MSDPMDIGSIAGHGATGIASGGLALGVAKFLLGSALNGLKEQMAGYEKAVEQRLDSMEKTLVEGRSQQKESLSEFKADIRADIHGVKEQLERSERRHDLTLADMGAMKQAGMAAHSRLDEHLERIKSIELRVATLERSK